MSVLRVHEYLGLPLLTYLIQLNLRLGLNQKIYQGWSLPENLVLLHFHDLIQCGVLVGLISELRDKLLPRHNNLDVSCPLIGPHIIKNLVLVLTHFLWPPTSLMGVGLIW